jgi:hypothetical protein
MATPVWLDIARFRQTRLGPDEFVAIQQIIDEAGEATLAEVARQACLRFGWVRPNGEPPISGCSIWLRRAADRGLLRLPQARRWSGRKNSLSLLGERARLLDELGPVPGMVECQPSGPLTVRPIADEERDGFRLHLSRYHYLGFEKPVGESICYVALLGNDLVALLVWGAAVLHNGPRDRLLGWDAELRARNLLGVVNNRRFAILPWIRQPHLATRILGANLRRLQKDWLAVYRHPIWLAETFVDTSRFKGTCYRASNWQHIGQTLGFSRTRDRGFAANNRPKAVFIYPLHRRALEHLRA